MGFLWFPLTFISCHQKKKNAHSDGSDQAEEYDSSAKVKGSNEEFARRLEIAYNRYPANSYKHRNADRVTALSKQIRANGNDGGIDLAVAYSLELISSRKTELAITNLLSVDEVLRKQSIGINQRTKHVYDTLALAYLRLGEEQNCCANHNAESCLFPLKGQAVHTLRQGSESAIPVLKSILEVFPEDHQSRYLLNIAYMTLGEYPDKVPEEFLIPKMGRPSEINFPSFPNIAIEVGADVVGISGGVCLEDFNNDGRLDILCSSYGLLDPITLLLNRGEFFEEVSKQAGLGKVVSGLNMIHADYDNDGDHDVFLLRGGWLGDHGQHPNSLLRNRGDGTFEDVTIDAGVYSEKPTQNACWADFNNDGWLDLFVGNESREGSTIVLCEFYLNQGDGTFKEVAKEVGLNEALFAKGSAVSDFNNDGWQDLYVSCLKGRNRLYQNLGLNEKGLPHFRNVAKSAGVEEPFQSFPCWFFDYDNDGFQDLFVADYDMIGFSDLAGQVAMEMMGQESRAEKARLFRNRGDGTFEDVTRSAGLWRSTFAMGCNFGDLNNDGFLDFYLGTGAPDLRMIVPNLMFLNDGGEGFIDVTSNGRFGNLQKGHAVAFGDIDNDGDQDLYAVMGGAVEGDYYQNILFENPGWDNRWVTLKLRGTASNRSAVGALIRVRTLGVDGKEQSFYRRVGTGGSFGSSSLQQEIGLGLCAEILTVEINWPNGKNVWESIEGVRPDKFYQISEGENKVKE